MAMSSADAASSAIPLPPKGGSSMMTTAAAGAAVPITLGGHTMRVMDGGFTDSVGMRSFLEGSCMQVQGPLSIVTFMRDTAGCDSAQTCTLSYVKSIVTNWFLDAPIRAAGTGANWTSLTFASSMTVTQVVAPHTAEKNRFGATVGVYHLSGTTSSKNLPGPLQSRPFEVVLFLAFHTYQNMFIPENKDVSKFVSLYGAIQGLVQKALNDNSQLQSLLTGEAGATDTDDE